MNPSLILGTAMWGWTVSEATAFAVLDAFYQHGFRQIDTATNYPINKIPEDFRKAEKILLQWIKTHNIKDLEIIIKVGSINNLRTPEHNLSKSFLLLNLDDYRFQFDSNFHTYMIHWDNRDSENEIRETLEALDEARKQGLRIGLSGIQYPEIYFKLNQEFQFNFRIQMKHNLLQSDYQRYTLFHGKPRFIAYGINAGGLKLNTSEYRKDSSLKARGGPTDTMYPIVESLQKILKDANQKATRPKLKSMNHIGMLYAYHSADIEGILVGPSSSLQLHDTIEFYRSLQEFDYEDVFEKLKTSLTSDI